MGVLLMATFLPKWFPLCPLPSLLSKTVIVWRFLVVYRPGPLECFAKDESSSVSHIVTYLALVLLRYSYMMIKGKPCKVLNISVSKTGKHGHAKCNFTATDIFTGKKLEDMIPSTHGTTVPIVTKTEWEVIDIEEDGEMTLMDEAGNQKTDMNLPSYPENMGEEIRNAWNGGENQISVTVQAAVGIEQIIGYKKVTE